MLSLTSCLGSDDPLETIFPDDAELLSFGLSHDSIPELALTVFSIDQAKSLIYNHDSMTYQTDIYEPVIVNYTNSLNTTNVLQVTAEGDSIKWIVSGTDSLDFSSQPVFLKVFSLVDTAKTKIYKVQINIHQIDPDSVQYTQLVENVPFLRNKEIKTIYLNGKYYLYAKEGSKIAVYQSDDVKNWQEVTTVGLPDNLAVSDIQYGNSGVYGYANGDLYISYNALEWKKLLELLSSTDLKYPVKSILGFKEKGEIYEACLSAIVEKDGQNVFAFTHNLEKWTYKDKVPDDFPLSGFSVLNDSTHSELNLILVGGVTASGESNAIWATENGYYWSKRTNTPTITGANAFLYDNKIYLLNGKEVGGAYNRKVYFSPDGGTSWHEKPAKCQPSGNYSFRQNASLIVDQQGKYFYIIGGQAETELSDIWQAFLNKKTFAN
jgi:hypothetical protein